MSKHEIDFAGYCVTETEVKPLDKYLRAISEFPTLKSTKDIRAWFGLVRIITNSRR